MSEIRRKHISGKRTPLRGILRDPIVTQVDGTERVAIRSVCRQPVLPLVPYIPKCGLCATNGGCNGNELASVNVVYVHEGYDDWEGLKLHILALKEQNIPLRLVMEQKVPKRILWLASYSDKNVFQINLNLIRLKSDIDKNIAWAERTMILANRCGIYCILMLHPVIPSVISSYHAIVALDRLKGYGLFQTVIQFCEIIGQLQRTGDYLSYKGEDIKAGYMVKTSTGWKCSNYFKSLFMDIVEQYAAPRKLLLSVCDGQPNYEIES